MAYGICLVFRANLYVVWFFCDCVMVKHCVLVRQNSEQNGKQGCAQISAHPCESATSTLDNHNFLVRTPIFTFFDSTESSLSLEFNKIKFPAKIKGEH